ncbi:MAG: TIGR02186 family protein, partial [Hansschlegelia sp.]
ADKTLVARRTITFRVAKAGFEAKVADVAERIRLGYGVGVAGLALLFGWAASAMFRRD